MGEVSRRVRRLWQLTRAWRSADGTAGRVAATGGVEAVVLRKGSR